MAKPLSVAWANAHYADTDYVIEPSTGKKSAGWAYGELPPHQEFNWLHATYSKWLEEYLDVRLETNLPTLLYSSATASWNGSDLVLSGNLDISFRVAAGEQINRIAAGTLSFSADGNVLVLKKDKTTASPVTCASGAYGSLDYGEYAILAEISLTEDDIENEVVIFRRRGTNLECVLNGLIYPTGATITFGQGIATASSFSGTLAATNGGTGQSSYTTGDLLYASSSTALSKLADVATGNSLISGGVGVAPSWGKIGLTTHVSGTLPVANGGTGTTTSTGTDSVVLSDSPTFTGTVVIPGCTMSGTWSGAPTMSGNIAFSGSPTFSGNVSFDSGLFYVDATNGRCYVNSTTTQTVNSLDPEFQVSGTNYAFMQRATSSGATGVVEIAYHDTSSAAVNDDPYTFSVYSKNSSSADTEYFKMYVTIADETASSEDAEFYLALCSSSAVSTKFSIDSSYAKFGRTVAPLINSGYNLGSASYEWDTLYCTNSPVVSSDRRLKTDIAESDLGLDFLNSIQPVKYKIKDVNKVEYVPSKVKLRNGKYKQIEREKISEKSGDEKRFHYGMIAQQVKDVLGERDFAGYCYDKIKDKHMLRYQEFISPIIRAIQELSQKISALENQTKH